MISRELLIVAYDITLPQQRALALKMVRHWRVGGQKSVHECRMTRREAEAFMTGLAGEIDAGNDRLLLAWVENHRQMVRQGAAFARGAEDLLWLLG